MNGRRRSAARTVGLCLAWGAASAHAGGPSAGSGQFTGGGGSSASPRFAVAGTIGQPVATTTASVGGRFASRAGSWAQSTLWLNTLPSLAGATNAVLNELIGHTQDLVPTDPDFPPQALVVALLQGPAGLVVTNGVLAWTPSAAQGPSTNLVEVSVTDGIGAVTRQFSLVVLDTMVQELDLIAPASDADRFRFEIRGTAGIRAQIESSQDLVNWQTLSTRTVPGVVEVPANAPAGFFRAVLVP